MERGPRIFSPEWTQEHRNKGIREVPPEILEWAKTQEFRSASEGICITDVMDRSPGAMAGLEVGDVILALDDQPVIAQTFSAQFQSGDGMARVLRVRGQDGALRETVITPNWNEQVQRWVIGVGMMDTHQEEMSIPEDQSSRRVAFAFDRGALGVVRGYAEIERSDLMEAPAYALKRYALFYKDAEGRSMEVDLLERWNTHQVDTFIDPTVNGGQHEVHNKRVLIGSLSLPVVPQTLAHEYRHTTQATLPRFQKALALYESIDIKNYENDHYWTKMIRFGGWGLLVRALMVGGVVQTRAEGEVSLRPIREQFERYEDAVANKELHNHRKTQNIDEQRLIDEEYEQALANLPDAQTPILAGLTVRDILRLPTFVIERDAQYGALLALRSLRADTGIDLLRSPAQTFVFPEGSEEDAPIYQQVSTPDSLQMFRQYLSTIGVPVDCVRTAKDQAKNARKERLQDEMDV